MKTDIILSGVGGQGILSIATIIAEAVVREGLYMKQSEVHGMSQRGGDVQSNLRISDRPIHSDLIPSGQADLILSLEPMEALRYLPFLSPSGCVVTSSVPFVNIPAYPEQEALKQVYDSLPNKVILDVEEIARRCASPRSANMVLLGAATPFLPLPYERMEEGIKAVFGRKGDDIVAKNLEALAAGKAVAEAR